MDTLLQSILVGIVIHFLTDGALQLLLGLDKTRPHCMLIHSLTADGLALATSAYLIGGWEYAVAGLIVGTVAHTAVDLWGIKGSIVLKFYDQALHLVGIALYLYYIGAVRC